MLSPRQILLRIYAGYLFFFLLFFIVSYRTFPAAHDIILQLYMLTAGFVLSQFAVCTKGQGKMLALILGFQVTSVLLMTGVNVVVYGDTLGFNPADAATYRKWGQQMQDGSLWDFCLNFLFFNQRSLDDLGFSAIVWTVYHYFGNLTAWILPLLNTIVVTWGSLYVYRLARHFLTPQYSRLAAVLWGMMPFAVYTAAAGLKENFFVFFVIAAFYRLYRQHNGNGSLRNLALLMLNCAAVFLFRNALGYAIILSALSIKLFDSKFYRSHPVAITILAIVMSGFVFQQIATEISQGQGYSYDHLSENTDEKIEENGGMLAIATNITSGLIGPIPNFTAADTMKRTYITRYSFSPFLKLLISYWFFYAIYICFRRRTFRSMPLVIFMLLNTVMLIALFYSMHDRYQWPHIPAFIILSLWGYCEYGKQSRRTHLYPLYLLGAAGIILLFNFR